MKKIILTIMISVFVYASPWCSVSGLKIADNLDSSYQAKLQSNDKIRVYANVYALLEDMKNLGLYDIKKYDTKLKSYVKVSEKELRIAKLKLGEYKQIQKEINKKRYYPMGKKIYQKKCQNKEIDVEDFINIADLKEELQSTCKISDETHLQAVALYMWDILRDDGAMTKESRLHVNEHEKCPVCGMYVYKYPKWAAQIYYKDKHFSFDGVKDLMKWYFDHKDGIQKILVSDYYSMVAIDGTKAYYVVGSDKYGPMGHEFVPFESLRDAKNFLKDHRGKKILKFSEITKKMPYALDHGEF
ncbi:nitrous oxide reductase accessory protein NosL [Sulfurospirillum sp. 1307]|jgi:nitrous oxide reductase accessory protein NosL